VTLPLNVLTFNPSGQITPLPLDAPMGNPSPNNQEECPRDLFNISAEGAG